VTGTVWMMALLFPVLGCAGFSVNCSVEYSVSGTVRMMVLLFSVLGCAGFSLN